MRRALLALPLLALTFTVACDAEESDSEFRAQPAPLSQAAVDVDVELFSEAGDGDGTVIWDIKEAGVHDGDSSAPLLLTLGPAGQIYDAMGVHTCTLAAPYLNKKVVLVTGPNNEVLYTIYNNWLLTGEIPPAKLTDGNIKKLLPTRLLFTFSGNEVWHGSAGTGGDLIATASSDLTTQSQNRKLLIGALIEGECGSNGLPGYSY